jgi:hypothetical protein
MPGPARRDAMRAMGSCCGASARGSSDSCVSWRAWGRARSCGEGAGGRSACGGYVSSGHARGTGYRASGLVLRSSAPAKAGGQSCSNRWQSAAVPPAAPHAPHRRPRMPPSSPARARPAALPRSCAASSLAATDSRTTWGSSGLAAAVRCKGRAVDGRGRLGRGRRRPGGGSAAPQLRARRRCCRCDGGVRPALVPAPLLHPQPALQQAGCWAPPAPTSGRASASCQ